MNKSSCFLTILVTHRAVIKHSIPTHFTVTELDISYASQPTPFVNVKITLQSYLTFHTKIALTALRGLK